MDDKNKKVVISYTNWKGETRDRIIIPQKINFISTEWHPEEQWIVEAIDVEKNALRHFAMKDIHSWKTL